jgi:hypothetical protein
MWSPGDWVTAVTPTTRNSDGSGSGPLARALDLLAE